MPTRPASDVTTAPLVARTWVAKAGPGAAAALGATYLLSFGLSHPLAKKIGPWPSVLAVTVVSSAAAWARSDRR